MKIFRFVQNVFFIGLTVLSDFTNASSLLNCISMKNQECKTLVLQVVNGNGNNPIFHPFSIKISKCSGNWNNNNDPYAKICLPDVIKNLNVKVFNLMLRTNETRFIEWHETCKCICRLDWIICNSKQQWNEDKCRCEYKKLIDKGICDKGYIWYPSICECECDKTCDIGEYLDYSNCKFRKKIDKLIDECTETIEEVTLAKITPENENSYYKCMSCKVYIVFMIVVFTIFTGTNIYFVYYNWSLIKNNVSGIKFNTHKETQFRWMQHINGRIKRNKY